MFDPYCLTRSLENLLDNAIKFTERGGVTVRIHRDESGALCLSVRDTGVGVDPSYAPHLFERFSQEESGSTRRFEGAGIGLVLVKRYVEMNQAEVSFQSEKGRGSTFRIRFAEAPVASLDSPAELLAPSRLPAPPRAAAKPLVLVVEDDLDTQGLMRWMLANSYRVLLAGTSEEAQRHLEMHQDEIRMILMDLSLSSSENGLELTKRLRQDPRWTDLPIVAVTAHALAGNRANAVAAGCDACVTKPIDREALLATMRLLAGGGS